MILILIMLRSFIIKIAILFNLKLVENDYQSLLLRKIVLRMKKRIIKISEQKK